MVRKAENGPTVGTVHRERTPDAGGEELRERHQPIMVLYKSPLDDV